MQPKLPLPICNPPASASQGLGTTGVRHLLMPCFRSLLEFSSQGPLLNQAWTQQPAADPATLSSAQSRDRPAGFLWRSRVCGSELAEENPLRPPCVHRADLEQDPALCGQSHSPAGGELCHRHCCGGSPTSLPVPHWRQCGWLPTSHMGTLTESGKALSLRLCFL